MARITTLGGYPIAQHDSPNKGGPMTGHRGVVLHIAQGTYRGTVAWQLNPDQRYADGTRVNTCSTWVVGREPGEWAQMVDSELIAWCQRAGSRDWLSIELAGYAPQAPSDWQMWACAQLLVWASRSHGIPVQIAVDPSGKGLGHHSMDREWLGEEWGHEACPGIGVIGAKPAIVTQARAILAPPSTQEEDMPTIYLFHTADGRRWRGDLIHRVPVPDGTLVHVATVGGVKVVDWTKTHDGAAVLDPDAFGVELPAASPVDLDPVALAAAVEAAVKAAVKTLRFGAVS